MSNPMIQPEETEMTAELLQEMITYHKGKISGYEYLQNMYEGNHKILEAKAKEKYKPDNRLVANFAKYIVDTFNGYFIGVPIKISHKDEKINDYLNFLDGYNDQDDNNAELSKICSIYGHGYELVFNDEQANIGITYLTPMEAFIVYDESIRQQPLFAVRYFQNKDGNLEGSFSDQTSITYFAEGDKGLEFQEPQAHAFDGLPMIEYVENEEKQSIFENVITLIEAFDKALSEKANDVEYYADAYLKILGAELDEENLKSLRDSRIINLYGEDAGSMQADFLSKPDADGTQENLLNRLENLIFHLSMVANLSDEEFGDTSGVALRYKLLAMDNLAKVKERKFTSGMTRRNKLIASYPKSKMTGADWVGISYQFTRNIPANLLEESQIAQNLSGIVSEETQLGVLSVVENAKDELANKNKEVEETNSRTVVDEQVLE